MANDDAHNFFRDMFLNLCLKRVKNINCTIATVQYFIYEIKMENS